MTNLRLRTSFTRKPDNDKNTSLRMVSQSANHVTMFSKFLPKKLKFTISEIKQIKFSRIDEFNPPESNQILNFLATFKY